MLSQKVAKKKSNQKRGGFPPPRFNLFKYVMKRKIRYKVNTKTVEREVSYIPVRYIVAFFITLLEVLLIIATVVALCMFVPYFYLLAYITQIGCVLKIISSDDAPEYKVPWLLFVLILPIIGFMLYFIFYSRKLNKKYIQRLNYLKNKEYSFDSSLLFTALEKQDKKAKSTAEMICKTSNAQLFTNTDIIYYPLGEKMREDLIKDLKEAEKFIYMEYFIIEEGKFWSSILNILIEKVNLGLDVRLIYDDIGCMNTLAGNYCKYLAKQGIKATPFSRLKGNANNEFNNRSHRKITVIDGKIGYTGGINIADEYVNEKTRFGHWKDACIRLFGPAVWELTRLFITDFGINVKFTPEFPDSSILYPEVKGFESGYTVPFGDGPNPIYPRRVGKAVIKSIIDQAVSYCYISTPYLIIDNDLCSSIETAVFRGVDVRIILPHIPDKKIVFALSKSYYDRFLSAGVKIYEYKKGFNHAKVYLSDDDYAMVGTINLDYRSLVHHFENGVWMYKTKCLKDIKEDFDITFTKCIEVSKESLKTNFIKKFLLSVVKIFAPLF